MDDIRIPCIVWFYGDPPPDLSGISDLIRIPFTIRRSATQPEIDVPLTVHFPTDGQETDFSLGDIPLLQLAASTMDPGYAARMLGYDRNIFGEMIHQFKPFHGLALGDNGMFHDDGDVFFMGSYIGNIHDFAP